MIVLISGDKPERQTTNITDKAFLDQTVSRQLGLVGLPVRGRRGRAKGRAKSLPWGG